VQGWTRRCPIYSLFIKILAKIFFLPAMEYRARRLVYPVCALFTVNGAAPTMTQFQE